MCSRVMSISKEVDKELVQREHYAGGLTMLLDEFFSVGVC